MVYICILRCKFKNMKLVIEVCLFHITCTLQNCLCYCVSFKTYSLYSVFSTHASLQHSCASFNCGIIKLSILKNPHGPWGFLIWKVLLAGDTISSSIRMELFDLRGEYIQYFLGHRLTNIWANQACLCTLRIANYGLCGNEEKQK